MCFLGILNIRLILQVAELRKRWLNQKNSFFEVQFLSEDNMNIIPCSIKTLKGLYDISGVEVGQHFYWQIGGFQIHAQVLITSWVVITILLGSVVIAVRNPQSILTNGQNFRTCHSVYSRLVQNSDWRRIWSLGSLYWNYVPFYFCFELVGCSFTLENYRVTPWGISSAHE